jgi:D-glycero-alpha-D-manno-heptose-7-phosphate kinase
MIISRTPLRISFVGGGSDISAYYKHSPGAVVSTAINKYIYITVNKKFDNKIRASYSKTEIVNNVNELEHEYIRESLKKVGIRGGIEITSIADIPSGGTGLGSSSSFIVGLLNALYAYKGKHVSAERLAKEACEIEIDILKKPIGKQDQYIAAYGGLQYIRFNKDESVNVDPIIVAKEVRQKLENRLILLYTGLTRSSSKILSKQTANLKDKADKKTSMNSMVELTREMAGMLQKST